MESHGTPKSGQLKVQFTFGICSAPNIAVQPNLTRVWVKPSISLKSFCGGKR